MYNVKSLFIRGDIFQKRLNQVFENLFKCSGQVLFINNVFFRLVLDIVLTHIIVCESILLCEQI